MSDIVKFEWDQPVEVALKYPDPKFFESQWGGERAMYSLTDCRVMYVDSLGAARITSLGVQPGELFFVVRRKNGRLERCYLWMQNMHFPLLIATVASNFR
jgi:hypothetical protein